MPSRACSGATLALVLALGASIGTAFAGPRASLPAASAPDLVPTAMWTSPSVIQEDEVVQLSVTLENRGSFAAWAATLEFVDMRPNGMAVTIGEGSLSAPLDPGANVTLAAPAFVAVGIGEHILRVRVLGVSPPESDPTNDALAIHVPVGPGDGSPPPPPPPDGVRIESLEGLGIGGLIVLVVVALAGFAISAALRGPPDETLVPPPPEPPDRRPPPIWPP
jgi:hypothetical protein